LPKDLSISNVVTVRSFRHVPSKTEMQGLHSRTSVAVEDVVADLKVIKNLEQRLRHRTSGTSTYSHTYDDHDDSQNPFSSRDAEVEALEQGSRNSATRRRVTVVIPISYAALREAMREREVGAVDHRRLAHLGGGRRRPWREACGIIVCHLCTWGPFYIVGRGCTLPPPQGTKGGGQREGEGAGGQGLAGQGNPNPGRPGPGFGAPLFFFLSLLFP
jgi:hypothetical protein